MFSYSEILNDYLASVRGYFIKNLGAHRYSKPICGWTLKSIFFIAIAIYLHLKDKNNYRNNGSRKHNLNHNNIKSRVVKMKNCRAKEIQIHNDKD